MMRFKDFRIEISDQGGWFSDPTSEQVDETLFRINHWVEENENIVLNMETLFFPGLNKSYKGTGSAVFGTGGGESKSQFFQVFRVWYQESKAVANIDADKLV